MKKLLILPFLLLAFVAISQNGYKVGDTVENFSLKNIDGKMVSLDASQDVNGYVVIFTCNHCPYSVLYEDRIIALDKMTTELGYPVIAINPNDAEQYPADSYENMKVRAAEKGFTFPYVVDDSQEVAKAFGATRTPHVFLVDRMDEDFVLKYIGAVDDSPRDEEAVEVKYVEDAVNSLVNNQDIATIETKAIGCSIKWKK